jgi:hypothetical protein
MNEEKCTHKTLTKKSTCLMNVNLIVCTQCGAILGPVADFSEEIREITERLDAVMGSLGVR